MGEIIDMRQYRMRKTAQRYLESKGVTIGTARDIKNQRDAAILRHPAGKSRHE